MRAPNGYGSVYRMSDTYRIDKNGKRKKVIRRKPWVFRVTTGYSKDPVTGAWKQDIKTVGTYATRAEAMQARDRYKQDKESGYESKTFAEIYDKFIEQKKKTSSKAMLRQYEGSYRKCEVLYDRYIREIRLEELQAIIDADPTPSGNARLKSLFLGVFGYADQNDYIPASKARYLTVKPVHRGRSTLHYTFTDDELKALWEHQEDDLGAFLLVASYTGLRTKELVDARQGDVDAKKKTLKIPKGKTQFSVRTIPIPDKVWPLIEQRLDGREKLFYFEGKTKNISGNARETYFNPKMKAWGLLDYEHPEAGPQQHKPYDTRHTFQSLWSNKKLDNDMMEFLVGHAPAGEGKRTYTHYDIEALRAEMNKL